MNKKLQTSLFVSIIFLSATSFAQTTSSAPAKVREAKKVANTYLDLIVNGVSTNLNYGNSNGAVKDYKKSVFGAQVGVAFQAGISPGFSLVPELYFMMKGGKLKVDNPLTIKETTLRLYTAELPLLARFHVGKFYMNAGPSVSYNIAGSNRTEGETKSISFNNVSEGLKRFEAGAQAGGGFEFPFKQKRVAVDLRYNYGLTNISKSSEIYNRSFVLSIHCSKAWKSNPLARK